MNRDPSRTPKAPAPQSADTDLAKSSLREDTSAKRAFDSAIVFLDFDGVVTGLTGCLGLDRGGFPRISQSAISLLNQLCTASDARVVVTSSYRISYKSTEIEAKLRQAGFDGKFHSDWRTPDSIRGFRGEEVKDWLTRHPEVHSYVIIDDGKDFYASQPLIRTDHRHGLKQGDVDKALKLLAPK